MALTACLVLVVGSPSISKYSRCEVNVTFPCGLKRSKDVILCIQVSVFLFWSEMMDIITVVLHLIYCMYARSGVWC